jgi:hypothetical protein
MTSKGRITYMFNAGYTPTLERIGSKIIIKVDGCVYETYKFKFGELGCVIL